MTPYHLFSESNSVVKTNMAQAAPAASLPASASRSRVEVADKAKKKVAYLLGTEASLLDTALPLFSMGTFLPTMISLVALSSPSLGVDSLAAVELSVWCSDEFQKNISQTAILGGLSTNSLVDELLGIPRASTKSSLKSRLTSLMKAQSILMSRFARLCHFFELGGIRCGVEVSDRRDRALLRSSRGDAPKWPPFIRSILCHVRIPPSEE